MRISCQQSSKKIEQEDFAPLLLLRKANDTGNRSRSKTDVGRAPKALASCREYGARLCVQSISICGIYPFASLSIQCHSARIESESYHVDRTECREWTCIQRKPGCWPVFTTVTCTSGTTRLKLWWKHSRSLLSKFVARKSWVVTGSDDMQISAFNYKTLEAHSDQKPLSGKATKNAASEKSTYFHRTAKLGSPLRWGFVGYEWITNVLAAAVASLPSGDREVTAIAPAYGSYAH